MLCGLPSARITLEMIIYKAKGNPDRPGNVVQKPFEGSDSPKILIRHKPFPVVRCPWHSTGSHPSSLPAPTFIRCEPQPLVRRRRLSKATTSSTRHGGLTIALPQQHATTSPPSHHLPPTIDHPPIPTLHDDAQQAAPRVHVPDPALSKHDKHNLLLGEHLDSLGICAFADPRQSGFSSSRRRPRCPRRRRIKTRNFPRVQAPDGGGNKSTSFDRLPLDNHQHTSQMTTLHWAGYEDVIASCSGSVPLQYCARGKALGVV